MPKWKKELRKNLRKIDDLSPSLIEDKEAMERVVVSHPMSIPEYYYNLIDQDDPHDPIRLLSVPSAMELSTEGSFDTSGEGENTKQKGLQHKYTQTALILVTNACFMYCRHCFRKRMVGLSESEINNRAEQAIEYVKEHKEVQNVLLTGGDSFMLSNKMIDRYLKGLSEVDHLDFIRFGTRSPVVMPQRIYDDPELLDILENYTQKKQIYVVTHFNHPREITAESRRAIEALRNRSIPVLNQMVLLKGINDKPQTIIELMRGLVTMGVHPYYVFQCRPVRAVKEEFEIPLSEAYDIVEQAKAGLSGPAKRFRFAMSHPRGKIEMVGKLEQTMIFRFTQAKNKEDEGLSFMLPIDPEGRWLERDLTWMK